MPTPSERTLILFKPDALQRRLCGRILERLENKGLTIVALKLMRISRDLAEQHYAAHKGKGFYPGLVSFVTSAPVVAMVLEGPYAIDVTRKMMGATFGFKAEPGTIRGDFGLSNQYNLMHGSDSKEAAEREIALFFSKGEILDWKTADQALHVAE
jgi:nucleoside-diphosphate kinase